MSVTHVRLLVHDYLASLRLWRDTVGLDLVFGHESGTYASFDTGSTRLSIIAVADMAAVVPLRRHP
jgi:catechol 2,3-dioxygenase-like lactoylglutathione lyase family enzyme